MPYPPGAGSLWWNTKNSLYSWYTYTNTIQYNDMLIMTHNQIYYPNLIDIIHYNNMLWSDLGWYVFARRFSFVVSLLFFPLRTWPASGRSLAASHSIVIGSGPKLHPQWTRQPYRAAPRPRFQPRHPCTAPPQIPSDAAAADLVELLWHWTLVAGCKWIQGLPC